MATLGIDGLASGLDTTAIISQLMQLEAAPQTLLKTKQQTEQQVVSALQSMNVKIRSLAEFAGSAADPTAWKTLGASASSSAATAVASETATAGSLTFSVGAVATTQISLSDTIAPGDTLIDPPTLTIKRADGTLKSITATTGSPTDIAAAINAADLGITATVVRLGSGDTAQSRLQFTSAATGTAGSFEVFSGDAATVGAGGGTRLDGAIARAAADASLTLWAGSAHAQTFTQSSNTFTGLMTGVDVTVASVTEPGQDATITVAPDPGGVKKLATDMVGALTVALAEIDSRVASTTTTENGVTSVKGGLLSGEASVRMLRTQLVEAASYPVDGISPSSVGINLGRDGKVTLDEAAFSAAVAADPEGTAAFMQSLAQRIQGAADAASEPTDGTLTQLVTNRQSSAERFADEILAWDRRLEMRRSTLQRTYSNLELTLSNLNSQSSWLAGQLSTLPQMNSQ